MNNYFDVFLITLGWPYVIVCGLVVAFAFVGDEKIGFKAKGALGFVVWCTIAGAIINVLYVNVPVRILAFCVLSLGGIAIGRLLAPLGTFPFRDEQ